MKRFLLLAISIASGASAWASPPEALEALDEGLLAYQQGNLPEAQKAYERALELDPAYGRAMINLGIVKIRRGQIRSGLEQCNKAHELEPGAAMVHYCFGLAYKSKEPAKAAAAFEKSIKLFAEDPVPKIELAHLRRKAGKYAEAVELYRDAVRKRPDDPDLHVHLGYCYKKLNDWVPAEIEYRKAVQKDPTSYFGHLNLGVVLVHNRKDDEAQIEYEAAAKLEPDKAEPFFNLGNLHRRQGRLEQAAAAYEEAAKLGPDQAEHHLELARTYWRMGRRAEAEAALKKAKKVAKGKSKTAVDTLSDQMDKYPVAPKKVSPTRPKVDKSKTKKPGGRTPQP